MACRTAWRLRAIRSLGARTEIHLMNLPQLEQLALMAWGPEPGLSVGAQVAPQRGHGAGAGPGCASWAGPAPGGRVVPSEEEGGCVGKSGCAIIIKHLSVEYLAGVLGGDTCH